MEFKINKIMNTIKKVSQPYRIKTERLVRFSVDRNNCKKIEKRIIEKKNQRIAINVLFLMQYPEMWNSHKSVYDALRSDDRFNVYVLTIPKPVDVGKGIDIFEKKNVASEYCEKNRIKYVEAREIDKWINIDDCLEPDIVFIQRPYDGHMPSHLSLRCLSKNSILCYIPYGYEFGDDIHLKYEYNRQFINNVFCCFAENQHTFDFLVKRSKVDVIFGVRHIFNLGYPRFDLIESEKENYNHRKNVLWTPRWSVNEENDRSFFFDYFEVLFSFFTRTPEMNLVIRPHPLMFKNFIDNGILSREEYKNIIKRVDDALNIKWDKNYDYLASFSDADILISDFSTLIIEFFITNKPIIYCGGNTNAFNSIGKRMMEGVYQVSNKEELINKLLFLANNHDEYYEQNAEYIQSVLKKNKDVGTEIKNAIVDLYIK